jgi:hypothetical protein
MELIFGVIVAFALSIILRIYFRFFAVDSARVKPFEQWCGTHPLVLAFRCPPEETVEVYEVVRRQIEPWKGFINTAGRYPWQHYVVGVDCRRLSEEVIAFYVTSCRPQKVREKRWPDVSKSIEEIGRIAGDRIDEVWLHGQFHTVNRVIPVDRTLAAWHGEFARSGELDVAAMIGQPPWLAETVKTRYAEPPG